MIKKYLKGLRSFFLPFFFGSFLLLVSCGSSRGGSESVNGYAELQELVNSRQFEIENEWAQPLSGNRINLIGNTNYMRFKNDSVIIDLPYFGVRHSGGGYNRDGGINYEGPLKNLEIEENTEDKAIRVRFDGQQDTENLFFSMLLFSNGRVETYVRSSQRNSITYDGEIKPLSAELR